MLRDLLHITTNPVRLMIMWLRAKTAKKITIRAFWVVWILASGVAVDFVSDYLRQQGENPKGAVSMIHVFLAHYVGNPWIGWPLYSSLLLLTGFTLGLWTDDFLRNEEKNQSALPLDQSPPDIGSLKFFQGVMEIGHNQTTGDIFVDLRADVTNANDYMIEFEAILSGSANGITPDPPQRKFGGFIAASDTSRLMYDRILGAKFNDPSNFNPAVTAFLTYDLKYKRVQTKEWTRRSGRSLRFLQPANYIPGDPGTLQTFPITVRQESSYET